MVRSVTAPRHRPGRPACPWSQPQSAGPSRSVQLSARSAGALETLLGLAQLIYRPRRALYTLL